MLPVGSFTLTNKMSQFPLGGFNPSMSSSSSPEPSEPSSREAKEARVNTNIPPPIKEAWDAYTKHLKEYFYNPDIEASTISLAAAASHFHKDCDPCWLFILGPSSGDKTSICINSLLNLPTVHMQGDITAKTLLSGYTGTAHPSLLHKIGSGILAFKDFTTFMSKRPEEQAEIASQLREVYDGSFVKNTGKGVPIKWSGKITVIAAATPALERAWSSRRDLGERFLQVRISRKDGIQQSQFAQRQRGKEDFISTTTKRLAAEFFQCAPHITNPPPPLSSNQMTRVAAMAELVSHCRGTVPRHPVTNAICDLPQIENSGRMAKAIASLISNHAALFRKTEVDEDDMNIGKRIALNTIPATRGLIIELIPLNGYLPNDLMITKSSLPESTISLLTSDLEALGVLKIQHNTTLANNLTLSPTMTTLWKQAFDPISTQPLPQSGSEPSGVH